VVVGAQGEDYATQDPSLHFGRDFGPGEIHGTGRNAGAAGDGDGIEFFEEAEF